MKFKDRCEICNTKIQSTFLGKIIGTSVKDEKGSKHTVCFECQSKFGTKAALLEEFS